NLALIFITHNLGIVAKMCDQVAVMYAGRLVESGPVKQIYNTPAHPYTPALLESIPRVGDSRKRLTAIDGQPPDPSPPPPYRAAPGVRVPPALAQRHGPVPDGGAARISRRGLSNEPLLAVGPQTQVTD